MGCIPVAVLRTRALPRWTGYAFMIAAVYLLGQYAAFRGALPFPQFLAAIAIGIAALVTQGTEASNIHPGGTDRRNSTPTATRSARAAPKGEPCRPTNFRRPRR